MTDLPLPFPDTTPEDRATDLAEWILAEWDARDNGGIYIDKLGDLVLLLEAYHIEQTGEPYIDIDLHAHDQATCPKVIRLALQRIKDAHLGRRAYYPNLAWHSNQTYKLLGERAEPPNDDEMRQYISYVLDECEDVPRWDLLDAIRDSRPLPWE